jgi:hypothetical protein
MWWIKTGLLIFICLAAALWFYADWHIRHDEDDNGHDS